MSLEKYVEWSRSIADELLDLLTEADLAAISQLLADEEADPFWDGLDRQQYDEAIALLSATPAARAKQWQRTPHPTRHILWIRARTLALQSANAIQIGARVADIEGMKYRDAVQHIAQFVLQYKLFPEPSDLLDSPSDRQ